MAAIGAELNLLLLIVGTHQLLLMMLLELLFLLLLLLLLLQGRHVEIRPPNKIHWSLRHETLLLLLFMKLKLLA